MSKRPANELDSEEEKEHSKSAKRLMPKKGDYRMRAHVNVLNDTVFPVLDFLLINLVQAHQLMLTGVNISNLEIKLKTLHSI